MKMKPEPTYEELMIMNARLKEQLTKALEKIVELSVELKSKP